MKKEIPAKIQNQLLKVVARALNKIGWKPLVIGGFSIRQGDLANNFEFCVKFTAPRPPEEKP